MPYRLIVGGASVIECDTPKEAIDLVGAQQALAVGPQGKFVGVEPVNVGLRIVAPSMEPPSGTLAVYEARIHRRGAIIDVVRQFGRDCHRTEVRRALATVNEKQFLLDVRALLKDGRLVAREFPKGFIALPTALAATGT